jgi:hypothetical protein
VTEGFQPVAARSFDASPMSVSVRFARMDGFSSTWAA